MTDLDRTDHLSGCPLQGQPWLTSSCACAIEAERNLDADVQFMVGRVEGLLKDAGVLLRTDPSHNRIIVERPNAAVPGVIVIELRGARA